MAWGSEEEREAEGGMKKKGGEQGVKVWFGHGGAEEEGRTGKREGLGRKQGAHVWGCMSE